MNQKNSRTIFTLKNAIPTADILIMPQNSFHQWIDANIAANRHLTAFIPLTNDKHSAALLAIFSDNNSEDISIAALEVNGNVYDSLTISYPQFHIFEREIFESTGIKPKGHPWLKPVRFPSNSKFNGDKTPPEVGDINFFRIQGEEIHQVAVGPVHAGIIEPGHFRFQCHGEIVHHLEISLGYQHRGIEKTLKGSPTLATLKTIEVAAGDSTVANTYAYCNNIEKLSDTTVSELDEKVRIIALELERCANHIGDLGAMAGDVGYLPTMSYCGRIRGDFLNMTGLICGNRFGRGLIIPGGTGYSINEQIKKELLKRLENGKQDFLSAVNLLWDSSSVLARFEDTGIVSKETAKQIGMVGLAARASGVEIDSRLARHGNIYQNLPAFNIAVEKTGDVAARGKVRYREVLTSIKIINDILTSLKPSNEDSKNLKDTKMKSNAISISFSEGWRGEICHIAKTDENSKFSDYRIIDPSMHNWYGLALALRGEKISDFPICNKSFSLSYCGFDL